LPERGAGRELGVVDLFLVAFLGGGVGALRLLLGFLVRANEFGELRRARVELLDPGDLGVEVLEPFDDLVERLSLRVGQVALVVCGAGL
jgi:hypothetical protein